MAKPVTPATQPDLLAGPRWQHALGLVLLLVWVGWWGLSLSLDNPRLMASERTYFYEAAWPYLGFDFLHEYSGGQALVHGQNAYQAIEYHPVYKKFQLPPAVLPLFAWCGLFPPDSQVKIALPAGEFVQPYPFKAVVLWYAILTGIFGWATYAVCKARAKLGLGTLAWPLALALILLSYPGLFTFEHGASDPLILLLMILGLAALRKKSLRWDLAAGLCLALAAWLKLYPAVLLIALLGLRRWRAAGAMLGGMIVIGLLSLPWLGQWTAALQEYPTTLTQLPLASHSLVAGWPLIWQKSVLVAVGDLPAQLGAALFVLIPGLLVTWCVYRSDRREDLALPYLLWMTALATFGPTLLADSPDYNLFFLLLAALGVWHWRDPIWVQLLAVFLILWWQPMLIAQTSYANLLLKVFGVLAVGLSLMAKMWCGDVRAAGVER